MITPDSSPLWLAADYHFPSTYSCRVPLSSMSSAKALPAPGPATIRLALLRTGIELFGEHYTRNILFPIVRGSSISIRPPDHVSLSNQVLRAYKCDPTQRVEDALVYREVAHASGPVTIYLSLFSTPSSTTGVSKPNSNAWP
jgi:hypothetical protein